MAYEAIVREAVAGDLAKVVALGREFLKAGPYASQTDNPEQAKSIAEFILENGHILVSDEQGEVTGVFAFIVFPHCYTGEKTANEMIWYVSPDKRAGGVALRLLAEAEKMARSCGAKSMQLAAPSEEVGRLYKYCGGYKKIEVSYQRAL